MIRLTNYLSRLCAAGAIAGLIFGASQTAYAGQDTRLADLTAANQAGADDVSPGNADDDLIGVSVTRDASGNLYGTMASGGSFNKGAVYRLAPDGTKTILHSFSGGPKDGAAPLGGVVADAEGNLYGLTSAGGGTGCANAAGCGTVFRITAAGAETIVYTFRGGRDGAAPVGNLVVGNAGQLFGTTGAGGDAGCGTVFEVSPAGEKKILHTFTAAEGVPALGVLHTDAAGNLYGATNGEHEALFRLTPDGTMTVLFQFA